MNMTIHEERLRALRRRNAILTRCRVYFPPDGIDFAGLHDPELSTDLRENDPHAYDTIVRRGIDGYRLH